MALEDINLLPPSQAKVEDENAGCPGICNFVDARTKWLDSAVARAIADGIRQVRRQSSQAARRQLYALQNLRFPMEFAPRFRIMHRVPRAILGFESTAALNIP